MTIGVSSAGISSVSYGSVGSTPSPVTKYSQTQLSISDAYKELQYWLSVYNYVQQFGASNISVDDVLVQIQRASEKLNNLQRAILPAVEGQLTFENQQNQRVSQLFNNQQQR